MLYRVGEEELSSITSADLPPARTWVALCLTGPADYRLMTGSRADRHIYGQGEPRLSPLGDGGDGFSDVPPGDGQRRAAVHFRPGIGGRRKRPMRGIPAGTGF